MIADRDLVTGLDSAAGLAGVLAGAPGPAGTVARILGAALGAASSLAKAGHDPDQIVERIRSLAVELDEAHDILAAEIDRAGWR